MGGEDAEPAAAATAEGQPAADVEVEEEAVNFAAAQISALRKADGKGKASSGEIAEARTKKQGFDAAEAAAKPMEQEEAAIMIQAATRGHQTRVKARLRIVQMEAQQWVRRPRCPTVL